MRMLLTTFLLVPALAFAGPKKKPEPAPAPAPAAPAPAPAPEPAPAPVEEAPPPMETRTNNVSFTMSITRADGSSRSGHVRGIERGADFHADTGWESGERDITFDIELPKGGEKTVKWSDVVGITIKPGKMPDDVDCTYSSDFNPFMYECSIRTTSTVTLKDKTTGNIITRNKWKFTFDDGAPLELYLFKHTERMQAEAVPGEDQEEDPGMYTKLQQTLRETLKGSLVTGIKVQ